MRALLLAALGALFVACAPPPTRRKVTVYADPAPSGLEEPRWLLRRASCEGSEQVLRELTGSVRIRRGAAGGYDVTLDQRLPSCEASVLYDATKLAGCDAARCPVALREQARVFTGDARCAASPQGLTHTAFRLRERELQFSLRFDALCAGHNVRLAFDAAPSVALSDADLARHFIAAFAARSTSALEPLLASNALLVPGLSEPSQGTVHGRDAILAWLRAERPRPWVSVHISELSRTDATRLTAVWEQMDAGALRARGATHFVLGGGTVFAAEQVRLGTR